MDCLEGKVVIITGSTSGIGLGIAKVLAKSGCSLVLNGFTEDKALQIIKEDLKKLGAKETLYIDADLSTADGCKKLIDETHKHFKRLDVLVNNAGIQYVSPVESFPDEKWNAILSVNLSACFFTTKAALPLMRQNKWGRIINIASTHGLVASKNKSAYVAAKHGVVGLTKVIALESAGEGITCNAICPGWVKTPLVEKQIEDRSKAQGISIEQATKDLLLEKQPSGQFVKPEDIGGLCAFLMSESANQITGASLSVDGGWVSC